jgi:MFS family permease
LTALAIDNVGSGLFLPLSLLYATRVVGLDVGVAGGVVAAATALGFAMPPVAARLTHRFGPRFVVVVAQVVQCAGALAYLLAGGTFGVLVAAGLMAAGTQLFYCSVFVLIADVSRDEAKERPFALVGMVRGAAFGLGALIAAAVLTLDSDSALRLLVACDAVTFVVAAAVLAGFVVSEAPAAHASVAVGPLTVLRDRGYLALMASTCLVALTMDVALLGAPVFLLDVLDGPAWLPGMLLAGGTVLSSLYGVTMVNALRGHRRTRSLQAGAVVFAVWAVLTMMMLWLPQGWLVPYACATWVVMVVGTKIFYPISGALSEALPPRHDRSGYMATYQYAFTTAQVLGPAVVALLAVAEWLPWAVVAASALAAVAVLDRLGRTIQPALNRSPAAVLLP